MLLRIEKRGEETRPTGFCQLFLCEIEVAVMRRNNFERLVDCFVTQSTFVVSTAGRQAEAVQPAFVEGK
jgi:hypothetical protein